MSDEQTLYSLELHAGPGAQVEVLSPGREASPRYQVRYVPPFHMAIRPPVVDRPLGPNQLNPINQDLDRFVALHLGSARRAGAAASAAPAGDSTPLEELGGLLLDLIIPRYIQADLRPRSIFLEFGVDEALLGYPWELMHDGDDFLCMRHAFGRFINGAQGVLFDIQPVGYWDAEPLEISVLLISVADPLPQDQLTYESIPHVHKEAEAIAEALTEIPGVRVTWLPDHKATYNKVVQVLRKERFHIIHFCGHAHTDPKEPLQSSLVLHDRPLTTGIVQASFGKNRPILCFLNGCESAASPPGRDRFDVYGLARAFLETGAYLIGSRWKVADRAASVFAPLFYKAFLSEGKPLGAAVRDARYGCRRAEPDDFAWASYVLYGDPRVCFRAVTKSRDDGGASPATNG
jgi:hypothetical protein